MCCFVVWTNGYSLIPDNNVDTDVLGHNTYMIYHSLPLAAAEYVSRELSPVMKLRRNLSVSGTENSAVNHNMLYWQHLP